MNLVLTRQVCKKFASALYFLRSAFLLTAHNSQFLKSRSVVKNFEYIRPKFKDTDPKFDYIPRKLRCSKKDVVKKM